ncbi:MAG: EamA family transporter [Candidatus Pacebacteria bacterium]|nr:EamA family transporter [Candidatus Paceibacterota bacterium]MBP9715930.1 EamA family transporter [Candidatus Paceibacterota bacterium]
MNKMGIKNWGPVFIIIAALLWAFDGVIRRSLYSLPPITIIFFEHIIGLVILLPFVWKKIILEKIDRRSFWLLLLVAILSGLLGTLWFTTALLKVHFISFSVVFLLQKIQPIFAITSSSILLKEKFEKSYIKWAVIAIIAAFFVTFKDGYVNLATGGDTVVAALYAVGAAFAWGTSTTFSKMILTKISHEVTTFYRFLFTGVISLVVLLVLGYGGSLFLPTLNQFGLFGLIAVSTGMVALVIYYKGLSMTKVHIATILELTFPFVAILIDMKLYNNFLSVSQLIAAFILCFSIYKIARINQSVQITN